MNHPDGEWLSLAKSLAVGSSRKIPSGCASSPCLRVSHTDIEYRAYCFACGESRSVRKQLRIADMTARFRMVGLSQELTKAVHLPTPAVADIALWPQAAKLWPLKAGLTYAEIAAMGLYYHHPTGRVVIPCGATWFQARSIDGLGAKYMSPSAPPPADFHYGAGQVVITEDCLSAYKVSLCGYTGWPVLGTKLTEQRTLALIRAALRSNLPLLIWLDPDNAGMKARGAVMRTASMLGVPYRVVRSARDPKLHSKEEIASLLNEAS